MQGLVNTLSEYPYFHILKDIYFIHFCLFLKLSKAASVALNLQSNNMNGNLNSKKNLQRFSVPVVI